MNRVSVLRDDHTSKTIVLQAQRRNRVYIAGPMTGLPDYNFPVFNEAAQTFRREGWVVENPAEHGVVDGATWADYMAYDLTRLGTCGAIYMLPGWKNSKGAVIEHVLAEQLGFVIMYAPGQHE